MGSITNAVNGVVNKLLYPFISKYLGSFVRTGLAALGGYIIAQKWVDAETANNFIQATEALLLGLLPVLIAQVASLIEKYNRD